VVAKLNAEISRSLALPEMKENLAKQGAEVRTNTPERFSAFIRDEKSRWAKVVKDANVKVE
jgi:tripartite-type tricarboxylate transporter receptor subunit TctC